MKNNPGRRVGIKKRTITIISSKLNHKIILRTKELRPLSAKSILSLRYNESEKCQQQINNRFELSININIMISNVLYEKIAIIFIIAVSTAIKNKNFVVFLIKKSCSSFKTTLSKNDGRIIQISSRYNIRSFRANILNRIDKIRLNKIRNEPKILKNAPFLP